MRCGKLRIALICLLSVVGAGVSPLMAAKEDLVLTPGAPADELLGRYEGPVRIALGSVSDESVPLRPGLVGIGPEGLYAVLVGRSWEETLGDAVRQVLLGSGLLATGAEEASYTLDVVLRRGHLSIPEHVVHSEIVLEFTLRQGSEVVGRILTCGEADRTPFRFGRKVLTNTFQEAFERALLELLESRTLTGVLGDGWHAAAPPESGSDVSRGRRSGRKAVSGFERQEEERASEALRGHRAARLLLKDFTVEDPRFLEKEDADAAWLGHLLPGLVQEHLAAFYPGALETVLWEEVTPAADDLIVSGQILRFKKGKFWKKSMIGYGAGKDKLDVVVELQEGASGETILELHRVSTDWGPATWTRSQPTETGVSLSLGGPQGGPVEEMADQLARDLAAFLVRHLAADYAYPEDLEVTAAAHRPPA